MITETQRLRIRELNSDDAAFVLELVNDPDWLRFIGDKQVRTVHDARDYIQKEGTDKYPLPGLGMNVVELKDSGAPIGICGLKKRDGLDHPDLGFAFLPAFRGKGYAFEACQGTMLREFNRANDATATAAKPLHLLAITTPDNQRSTQLLEKLGFRFVHLVTLPGSTTELRLYAVVMNMATAGQRD